MSDNKATFRVTYFPVRGSCEPVFLMLVDAGVTYGWHTVMSLEEWRVIRRTPDFDQYPHRGLPVLEVRESGRQDLILGETEAILEYLEEKLHPGKQAGGSTEDRAQMWMAKDAALFFINRIFQMSVEETWLATSSRATILEHIVLPYLRGTEAMLKRLTNPVRSVTAASASMFTAFLLSMDMFPCLEKCFEARKDFEKCGEVCAIVGEREDIKKWYEEDRVRERAWTLGAFGTAGWIREASDKFGQDDDVLVPE
ncbi:hypothetical protein FPV67DRAFT_60839 [Lyophyllum atratum]|nr:hypothetical protein FPV67DRAFT_60839 [Lyophyllum atratum]